MKTKMNRIYALLLTVFMIVGVLTASAFAEAEIPEENTIPEEEEIKEPLVVTSNAIDLSTIVLPPQEEEKPEEEPDLTVEIILFTPAPLKIGDEVILKAKVSGEDADKDLCFRWEVSTDEENWKTIEGAEDSTFSFMLDEQNIDCIFRVTVDLKEEDSFENRDTELE